LPDLLLQDFELVPVETELVPNAADLGEEDRDE
jgi:hypothetical protein